MQTSSSIYIIFSGKFIMSMVIFYFSTIYNSLRASVFLITYYNILLPYFNLARRTVNTTVKEK